MKILLIGLGFVAILLGIGAAVYTTTSTQSHLFGLFSTSHTSSPFQSLMIPLIIGGAILIIIGAVIGRSKKN
jgi:hypothetical protein